MSKLPNIVFCSCDQLRAFEVGCYGNPVIQTPNVDRLASEGLRFETAVTNFPICMAARSVMLSGQFNRTCTGGIGNVSFPNRPGRHEMPEYPFPGRPHLKYPTLPELLRARGYYTSAIGKWHIHSWPDDIGFDEYVIPRVHHCHTGQNFTENGGPEFVPPGYSVDFEAERVESFIRQQAETEGPFFLFYNISPPHCPVADAPEQFRTMYSPEDIPVRPNVDLDQPLKEQDLWFKIYRYDFRHYMLRLPYTEHLPDGYSLRHLIAEYYGMTTWMDTAFGRMLNALDACGLADDTIVVFTSDHGDNLGSLGLVQKGGPNEESIRIPLIIREPGRGREPAVINSHVGSLVDLAPTLLSLIGAEVPEHMAGRDLVPVCRGESADIDRHAFFETPHGIGVRTLRHMCYLPWTGEDHVLDPEPTQFFDLTRDPYQLQNLAGADQHVQVRTRLEAQLRNWHASIPYSSLST